jgi:hypothetical protein
MNTPRHTPGPWEIDLKWIGTDLAGHVPISARAAGRGQTHLALAQVVWLMEEDKLFGRNSPTCEANARLIVQAPALFDFIEKVAACTGEGPATTPWQEIVKGLSDEARALVAKVSEVQS